MARFRVSCLRESGVTALVKQPEAELILAITASCVHNTSQAEGHRASSHTAALLLPWRPLSRGLKVAYVSITVDRLRCKERGSSAAEDEHRPGFQRLY